MGDFGKPFRLLTMTGALIAEFALRDQPKWSLVYIATTIITLSILYIIIVNVQSINKLTKQN